MNRKPQCVELQSRMVEYFSGPPGQAVPEEIRNHLDSCGECRQEFAELNKVLEDMVREAEVQEVVPEHLLVAIESRLDSTPQLRPAARRSNRVRNLLIMQYSYLAFMSVVIWLTILFAQPILTGWLAENSMSSGVPMLNEYGLFLAFFVIGGIFALISSPLIIRTLVSNSTREKKTGFFARLFTGSLRMFAC